MKRNTLKNYNIFEVRISDVSHRSLFFSINFEHKYKIASYIEENKIFLEKLLQWTKKIEFNKFSAAFDYNEHVYETGKMKSQYRIIAKCSKKKGLIHLDFIDVSNQKTLYKIALEQDTFIRKVKSAIYYELKYNYQFKDVNKDKFVINLLAKDNLDTLKKNNNGISTIEVKKIKRNNISYYSILIDGIEIDSQRIVDIEQLVESVYVYKISSFNFYTCSCGIPECGGIYEPQIVYRSCSEYIYWDMCSPYGGRFKFDYNQYFNEIMKFDAVKIDWDELMINHNNKEEEDEAN